MIKITKTINETWPMLKTWPKDIGPLPTTENVVDAAVMAKMGTAVHMAIAMYCRTNGATDSEAAIAASAATGAKSATHRVKRDVAIRAGHFMATKLAPRGGHTVTMVALATKTVKAKKERKPATKALKAKAEKVEKTADAA